MTIFVWIFSVCACFAWIMAERKLRRVERRYSMLKLRYMRLAENERLLRLLLGDAINAMPQPQQGRKPGEPVDLRAWERRKVARLARDLGQSS